MTFVLYLYENPIILVTTLGFLALMAALAWGDFQTSRLGADDKHQS